jgi:formylglycine-generating enzyme required for sulfatase activity
MKYILSAILPLFIFSFSSLKKKRPVPPGTVQISENFFADETEVSNLSWLEYEYWTAVTYGSNSAEHLATLPDTNVWLEKDAYSAPYAKYYYRHLAYRNFPVVGISHDQALAFCKWRTARVKEHGYIAYKRELHFTFRLPSSQEWEMVSATSICRADPSAKNKRGIVAYNIQRSGNDSVLADAAAASIDVTAPVYSFYKNKMGLYNTIGNVAEMVSELGISKGGSWRHRIEDCRVGKKIPYTSPASWLGFRCVCIVN